MADKPVIFISATSDLRSARDLVGKVLFSMGYEPIWQDIEATDGGELLDVLRRRLAPASLVIQLMGGRYGAEPPRRTTEFGRVSYTQFEALEAERIGTKVIYHFLDNNFPKDEVESEPAELTSLQAAYRQRLTDANRLRYERITNPADLELSIRRIKDELAELRKQANVRHRIVVGLGIGSLVAISAVGIVAFTKFNRQEEQVVRFETDLAALRADVAAAISPKPLAAGQTQPPPIPAEIVEKAKVLVSRGNAEERALGMIALKRHAEADRIIQELKNRPDNPIDEAFRLSTMEGDNWYQAGEPDKAIEPYERAVALKPRDLHSRRNLLCALAFARLGNVSANLRRAIRIAEESLRFTPPNSTVWAMMEHNLGIVWCNLPTGDKSANVNKAIVAYQAALTVYTKEAHPVDWATTQNNLASAWWELPTGDKAENIKRAIAACEAALSVFKKEAHPSEWAMTQNNLGAAWSDLPTGDKAENVNKAIAAYESALTVYKEHTHPGEWAMTQNNLGNAWQNLPTGDEAEAIKKAINAYEAALTVRTKEAYPADWATTKNNIGNAWSDLPTGDKADNVKKALAAYDAALTVFTRDAYPADWAMTKYNLGIAWRQLPGGNRAENINKAVAAYDEVMSMRPTDLPARLRRMVRTSLSWCQLLTKNFAGALSTCVRPPIEDAGDLHLQTHHAHALLFLGRTEEARQIYAKYNGQKIAELDKSWEQTIVEDFDELEKNGLKSPEFAKIRELLKSKKAELGPK